MREHVLNRTDSNSVLGHIDRFPIGISFTMPGTHPVADYHEHIYSELVFVLAGAGKHLCNGQSIAISAGDVLCIHPGIIHAYDHDHKNFALANLIFDRKNLPIPPLDIYSSLLFKKIFLSAPPDPNDASVALLHLDEAGLALIENLLHLLFNEVHGDAIGGAFLTLSLFMQIIVTLIRIDAKPTLSRCHPAINVAISIINRNFRRKINIPELARQVGMSSRNLHRHFKIETGCTPNDYICRLRLKQIAIQLIGSQNRISDIAFDCGFVDPSYMGRCFMRQYGVSPAKFRKMNTSKVLSK